MCYSPGAEAKRKIEQLLKSPVKVVKGVQIPFALRSFQKDLHLSMKIFCELVEPFKLSQKFSHNFATREYRPAGTEKYELKIDCMEHTDVGILFDEMKINSGHIYNETTGKLVVFCELVDINIELTRLKLCQTCCVSWFGVCSPI